MGYFSFGVNMSLSKVVTAILLASLAGSSAHAQKRAEGSEALAAASAPQQAQDQAQVQTEAQSAQGSLLNSESGITQAPAGEGKPSERADAYYNYTMGHVYEQQYENTSKPEYASQAIEFYKKAYGLDPITGDFGSSP